MKPLQTGRYKLNPPQGFLQVNNQKPLLVKNVDVKGKFMWWELETPQKTNIFLHVTYGMSGQWSHVETKHASFSVEITESASKKTKKLFFNDQRRFGTLKFILEEKQHEKKLKTLGPDVLQEPPLPPEIFVKRMLKNPNKTIAEALMDQSCVSGIGNYLRAEVLLDSKIDPWKKVIDVTSEEYIKLCEACYRISKKSYESQGASIKTYRDVNGEKGSAQFHFKVYAQQKCPNEHEISRKKDSNGRTVHWCCACQV